MKINPGVFILNATRRVVLTLIALAVTISVDANEQAYSDTGNAGLSRLFQSHERLNIRLEAPFKRLVRKRGEDRPYSEAALIYKDNAGNDVRVDLKIRTRGKYRAKKEICRFPPLKLNFKKKTLSGTIFEGEDKLKLVTHCQSSSRYTQFVLLEYLNYQVQNLLTDYSLRARLATIEYYDTDSKKVTDTQIGFFIEDVDRMAARVGTERLHVKRLKRELYDQDQMHMTGVFEYMLGNTDFSMTLSPPGKDCCHNIIPLQLSNGSLVPVAYDFDATGIVNPPYVKPPKKLKIRSIRQRLYRGYCQNTEGFKKSFEIFLKHRDAIYDLYKQQAGLDSGTLKGTLTYLDQFYEAISDDDRIASEFVNKCRK